MKTRFPIVVTLKGVIAKIQRAFQIQNGKRYDGFMVIYSECGRRKRIRRHKLDDAKIEAKKACLRVSNGEHLVTELRNGERLTYLQAVEPLAPLGVKLDVAAHGYAKAIQRLPKGVTLDDAIDECCRRCAVSQEQRTVKQVVAEFLKVKAGANLSDAHLKDLECRLGAFAEAFQMDIGDVTGALLQTWIDSLEVSGRTKQNYLRIVSALINFAICRKWIHKELAEEVEAVQLPKEDVVEIETYTPEEMQEILSVARPEMIPWLAIGGFAGLRSAEIDRVDWGEILLVDRYIEIKPANAKTRIRRLVPISENLAKWLEPHAKESGPVAVFHSWWNQMPKIVQAVNEQRERNGQKPDFVWRQNALRHSYISYRMAECADINRVADEAGNSPAIIKQHYLRRFKPALAAQWFAIVPANN